MGIFKKAFRKEMTSVKSNLNVEPITGGDGSTPKTAAIVNCASQGMANSLIDKFISERHGIKDTEWKHTMSFFVNEDGIPEYSVRAYGIKLQNEDTFTYYFDISRPHNNEMKMFNKLSGTNY
jgi:hypothetical protein